MLTSFSQSVIDGSLLQMVFSYLFILTSFLYAGFAFVVTRQIKIMRTTVITSFSPVLRVLGYAHFLLAVAVFVFFLMILQ